MSQHTIINVGRQFGSGGRSVADALGRKLGIPVYDNELIAKAAEQSGFNPELFKSSDETKHVSLLGSIFSSNRFGSFTRSGISESDLFKIQSDAIRDIATKNDAIFVGRASDYVLRDMECLDVFIMAPLEERIARVSTRLNISAEDAETLILKRDKAREDYYNFFTFSHWGVAANYDLCVDSSLLGIDGTADFIIDFGRKTSLILL